MYRSLSWFEQLDVLLNATNGNVVRIKVRGWWRSPVCVGRLRDIQSSLACATVSFVAVAVSSWGLHRRIALLSLLQCWGAKFSYPRFDLGLWGQYEYLGSPFMLSN
ncbi:CCDC163 isoform 1 [Pongo abelii]|uniref:CCDC163 isoform 1 n=1 Tax=Pongo abelii TaxID=9601 RepID=A0A2J8SLT3_PONAB|nr:CCDC163 isoform 1 [Pongo abelii]